MTLDELRIAFLAIDVRCFAGHFPPVSLSFLRAAWYPGACNFRTAALSFDDGWLRCATGTEAIVTLKHEAAHLFARSFELRDHGGEWAATMMRFLPDAAIAREIDRMLCHDCPNPSALPRFLAALVFSGSALPPSPLQSLKWPFPCQIRQRPSLGRSQLPTEGRAAVTAPPSV